MIYSGSDQVQIDWPCAVCGRNTKGLAIGRPCPQCGTPVPALGVALQQGGFVQEDRPCLKCGYNLRGISSEAVCPECATPVANSLRGDLLCYSSPEYVLNLHRGVFLIQAAIVAEFVVYLGFPVIGIISAATGLGRVGLGGPVYVTGFSTLIGLVSVVGWWLFSARDPALGERDEGATARVLVRVTIAVQATASIVAAAFGSPGSPGRGPGAVLDVLGTMLAVASLVAFGVWWFAAMRYIRRLAPRLPSQRVYRRAQRLTWLGPVLLLLICIGLLIDLILYYNLLEWIRKDLKGIRKNRAAETAAAA